MIPLHKFKFGYQHMVYPCLISCHNLLNNLRNLNKGTASWKQNKKRATIVSQIQFFWILFQTFAGGKIIPAGASIILLISGIHLNAKIYPEPYKWNPDNFHADLVASRHPFSFLPFGGGPRICIGKGWFIYTRNLKIHDRIFTAQKYTETWRCPTSSLCTFSTGTN